jgi:hypothetical protein
MCLSHLPLGVPQQHICIRRAHAIMVASLPSMSLVSLQKLQHYLCFLLYCIFFYCIFFFLRRRARTRRLIIVVSRHLRPIIEIHIATKKITENFGITFAKNETYGVARYLLKWKLIDISEKHQQLISIHTM